ncbi:phosphotransferase enzyme family protein [Aspergillus heteromorphus CBS 117.55]|uniref:Phosphotransferase enzyme family protein n=1 Tax=Aspergillus heteromorphus CBS 117.55 TaxID=1448321 RepID=A0A317WLQ3_9EURO|nr:phosphotransferase enzyme family protein [Aspergillus heteromorphus CBS 117.55]PWY87426.1 phosphotransferase enzyme family protein [Aspergillus heteromorphus CBS 117.55]
MDTNALVDLVHEAQGRLWVDKVNETHQTGRLCQWVSTFHPEQLTCQLDGTFHHGSFNAGMKMVFSDSTAWMVRFPRGGKVCEDYMDEKVSMEVMALRLLRNKTTIPVPGVQAWGPAFSNPLGLGPFIIMDFIDGVSLSDLLRDPNAERPSRVMRGDIHNADVEVIYRQLANFLLQLFKLDFDRIGSLPSPSPQGEAHGPSPAFARPLTFKAHNILQNGGVDTFGDRSQGFATTTEYFQYVISQDWAQLLQQPNSTVGPYDAQNKYVAFNVLQALAPDLVNPNYDHCKFKLICDDLGLANLIVRSREDLTVVGVVDLEWSYIGPAQLAGSAPWWLLQDRPVNSVWDCKGDEPPEIAARYFKCLDLFIRILEEEEAKMPGCEDRELSGLVKWSQASGAMWLHMLISSGFNDHRSFPFTQLRQHLGPEWAKRETEFDNIAELESFAERKVQELGMYDEALEQMEESKALMESGGMTLEEFVASTSIGEGSIPRSSSALVSNHTDNEANNDQGLLHRVAAWLLSQAAKWIG